MLTIATGAAQALNRSSSSEATMLMAWEQFDGPFLKSASTNGKKSPWMFFRAYPFSVMVKLAI